MPGIVMEPDQTDVEKEAKLDEITSPQRSILDFFKSPTKPEAVGKPKGLLGFFTKSPNQNGSSEKSTVHSQTNGNVNGLKTTYILKEKKEETEALNSSLSEFETCKTKPRKGTKKQLKNLEKNEKDGKQDTSDANEKGRAEERVAIERDVTEKGTEYLITKKKTSKNEQKNQNSTDNKSDKVKNVDEFENKVKQNDSKNREVSKDQDKPNSAKKRGIKATKSKCSELAPQTGSKEESSKIKTSEINYMDFLKTLDEKTDDKVSNETTVNEELIEVRDNDMDKGDNTDVSKEKNYPSISSFFTKLSSSNCVNKTEKERSPNTLTTKADIHFEPTPPKQTKECKSLANKVCLNIEDDVKMNEIEVLSSETLTIASPVKSKGKRGRPHKSARKSLTKQLTDTIEINDDSEDTPISTDQSNQAEENKKMFLQSSNTPASVQKTSQATLSFGKSGLQMSSKSSHTTRIRKSETEEVLCDSPLLKSTPVKRGRGRPPGNTNKKKKTSAEDNQSEKEKLCKTHTKDNVDEKIATSDNTKIPSRRSERNKYKVDMISIDSKNRTPIRMRLTRCNKSGSSTDESFVQLKSKPSLKHSRAQKLLEKAKKTKKGKSPELKAKSKKVIKKSGLKGTNKEETISKPEGKENGERRRSSRLTDKLQRSMNESQDEVMIIDGDENERGAKKKKVKDIETPKKKPATPGKLMQKGTPHKSTPKKSSGKLAPIFMKKKPGEKVEELKKPVLDPEQERVRREFLMSGVPEALKKHTATATAAVVVADLPPFPSIRHVQQSSGILGKSSLDIWDLSNVELKYKLWSEECLPESLQSCWRKCLIEKEKIKSDLTNLKTFRQHSKIAENLLNPLLREVQRTSPSYNVDKMYKLLKEKKDDQDAELSNEFEDQSKDEKNIPDKQATDKGDKPKSKRRSLRLKKKDEIMEVIDLGSPEPVKDETNSGENKQEIAIVVPWPDKYQPTHSSEIVGNSNNIKKLKSWLVEWKHRVDKEAKKMKKLLMKESKNQAKEKEDEWWGNDDSDFDLGSDDSEEDEDKVCNTVMLMGPTGIGKTTTVYALAQELGFKVFEVNASSIRNGKRILSQLQEATQSHRVSHNKCEGGGPASILSIGNKPSPLKKKPEKNLPTSFANFFKKAPISTPPEVTKTSKTIDSKKGRKRKRDPDEGDGEKTPKKKKDPKDLNKFNSLVPSASNQATVSNQGLNLASTSLILFEDVDVVFEEDKGFWSAIQSFMNSTKIPIVLTTNDVTLSSKFDGKYEQFLFKTPSLRRTTVYLQLICLTEGIRTNSEEIMTLVKVLKGDIRRLLLALQYWVDSGGGTVQENQKVISPVKLKPLPICEDSCSRDVSKTMFSNINDTFKSKIDDDDEDDFISLKPAVSKRKRQIISDDESSNSAQPFLTAIEKSVKYESLQAKIHLSCLNSSLGLSVGESKGVINLLKQLVKGQNEDIVTMVTEACDQYRKLMYNIVYNTYTDLLPLAKSQQTAAPTIKTKAKEKRTQLKRIRTFDLYDSEASNDGFLDSPKEETIDDAKLEESKQEKVACIKSLDNFTEFYDNMSFIDSITLSSEVPDSSNSFILHSKRSLCDTNTVHSLDHIDKDNLCSEIEVRALYKMCINQKKIQELIEDQHLESISIPSIGSNSQGALVNRANNSTNLVLKKASNNVMSNLPLNVRCHSRSVIMDYMPVLRDISKAEKLREISKVKRRFHHYFDNIGLNLKDTTLDVLLTSFQ